MARPADAFSALALAYLALPSFMFLGGWTQLWVTFALGGFLLVTLLIQAYRFPAISNQPSSGACILLAVVAISWSAFGGAGHLMYSNVDWLTRDAVYADLFLTNWPPGYGDQDGAPLMLRTAMGYFLPPAALTKLLGIGWAPGVLFAWTALGAFLFLALLPLPHQFSLRLGFLVLVVVFFSGMDYAGIALVHGHTPIYPLPLEWWLPWTYSSVSAQLFWAPNHALPLWIGTALYFRHRKSNDLPALGILIAPLLLLWTPFAIIGLLPWFIYSVWMLWRKDCKPLRSIPYSFWISSIALFLLIASALLSPGVSGTYSNATLAGTVGTSFTPSIFELALHYVHFVTFEFLLLVLAIVYCERRLPNDIGLATGILCMLPVIRFGPSNDWILRVSTPSLIILLIVTLGVLERVFDDRKRHFRAVPVLLVLLVGSITPWFELMRAVSWPRTLPNYSVNLVEQQGGAFPPHYIGRFDSPTLGWLFRRPTLVSNSSERR